MNILIPHSWLLEHLDTQATPDEMRKYLSLCGPSVERIYDRLGEDVYDIEITTNRVDSFSVRGIAREAATILGQFGIQAQLKPLTLNTPSVSADLPLPRIVNDPTLCKRIICVVLANVNRSATPDWMAKRLEQTEMNVHDAVIDITNYITHELGHPVHAFDYDKVMELGGEIIVKVAEAGKKFTTLDGVEYTTVGGEIVFENAEGVIIDLPAIKGTANTSINQSTKNVLLWIENMDAAKVRFTSMTHAIRTVAAQLEEKQVDAHLAKPVLLRGIELYQQLCGAEVASEIYDDFSGQMNPQPITISMKKVDEYLGIELSRNEVVQILTNLEFEVTADETNITVTPPTFRSDVTMAADVIEEIARIYGYHNLPSVVMPTAIPLQKQDGFNFELENDIKHVLSDIGWQEVYTYSLVSQEVAEQSGLTLSEHLKIQNPLTEDRVYLRRSLIPSLVEVINQNSQREKLSVFEIAALYDPQTNDIPLQQVQLSMVSNKHYREVKGDFEVLCNRLHLENVTVEEVSEPQAMYWQQAEVLVNQNKIGEIGILKNQCTTITITMSKLMKAVKSHPTYRPIPKTAAVVEDLTFTMPEGITVGKVIDYIKDQHVLIASVELKEVYQQNYTFSLIYHDPTTNVSNEDIKPIRPQIVSAIQEKFDGQLVGAV